MLRPEWGVSLKSPSKKAAFLALDCFEESTILKASRSLRILRSFKKMPLKRSTEYFGSIAALNFGRGDLGSFLVMLYSLLSGIPFHWSQCSMATVFSPSPF